MVTVSYYAAKNNYKSEELSVILYLFYFSLIFGEVLRMGSIVLTQLIYLLKKKKNSADIRVSHSAGLDSEFLVPSLVLVQNGQQYHSHMSIAYESNIQWSLPG